MTQDGQTMTAWSELTRLRDKDRDLERRIDIAKFLVETLDSGAEFERACAYLGDFLIAEPTEDS